MNYRPEKKVCQMQKNAPDFRPNQGTFAAYPRTLRVLRYSTVALTWPAIWVVGSQGGEARPRRQWQPTLKNNFQARRRERNEKP